MENRIKELELQVFLMQAKIKKIQLDLSYMQKQIDNNAAWIEKEEKSKIL